MIDWDRITELRDEVGEDDFAEVAELFLEEVAETLGGFDPAASADHQEREFHALKGACLNLGFSTLSKMCAEGEAAAGGGQTGVVDTDAMRKVFAETRAAFLDRAITDGWIQ